MALGCGNIYFLSMKTQFENAGDLLINDLLVHLLSEQGEVYVDTSCAPADFMSLFTSLSKTTVYATRESRQFWKKFFGLLITRKSVVLVLKPGHISLRTRKQQVWFAIKQLMMLCSTFFGCGIIHVGHSFSGFGKQNLYFEDLIARRCILYAPRDSFTSLQLASRPKTLPDLSLLLHDFYPQTPSADRKVLAICVRGDHFPLECRNRMKDALLVFLQRNHFKYSRVTFVTQVQRDLAFHQEIHEAARALKIDSEVLPWNISWQDLLQSYQSSSLVLTNRLHACLPAMQCHTPVACLITDGYDQKITSLLESLQMTEPICKLGTDNSAAQNADRIEDNLRSRTVSDATYRELFRSCRRSLRTAFQANGQAS